MTTIPTGFELFGWHWFDVVDTHSPSKDSVVHLVGFEEVVYGASDPNTPSKVNTAICGQAPRGVRRTVDAPDVLRRELEDGVRKPCSGCWRKASGDVEPVGQPFGARRGMAYDLDYARTRSIGRNTVDPKDAA
jgi:hypothetical protein